MRHLLVVLVLVAAAASVGAQRAAGALDMYPIDVEGGNATLLVAPTGNRR